MGLDIIVRTTASELREALKFPNFVKHPEAVIELLKDKPDDWLIHTRPGSYHGLHVVRDVFADKMQIIREDREYKGVGVPTCVIPDVHTKYHLMNFSDCEGWYLPIDFDDVCWVAGGVSIGSSVRLLAELEELQMDRQKSPEWGWRWDAVYLAAAASCETQTPIRFS